MIERALRQFSCPTGPLGHAAGGLMARMNAPLNDWVVDLLDVRRHDRVLELGYGPGLGIERAARRAAEGRIAGVDLSYVMCRQATRRNQAAVRAGRVDLRVGHAGKLPFDDASFTRAFSINSLKFWPQPREGLAEMHRTLAPEGRLVLAHRMQRDDVGRFDRSRHGMTEPQLLEVITMLDALGFQRICVERRTIRNEHIAALRGER
jgi:ubiquinone/menaquinone biosynthesis C-methylase UbiE